MKGRANYLCLHRLDQLTDSASVRPGVPDVFLPIIKEWSGRTETGVGVAAVLPSGWAYAGFAIYVRRPCHNDGCGGFQSR